MKDSKQMGLRVDFKQIFRENTPNPAVAAGNLSS